MENIPPPPDITQSESLALVSEPPHFANSYCCQCDALPGKCDHEGPRYLDLIGYERVEQGPAARPVWRVPKGERWRTDNPPSVWKHLHPRELDYGAARPEEFPPVTTALADHVRRTGLRLLGGRYRMLAKRAARQQLSTIERRELDKLERVIATLEAMEPVEPGPAGQEP